MIRNWWWVVAEQPDGETFVVGPFATQDVARDEALYADERWPSAEVGLDIMSQAEAALTATSGRVLAPVGAIRAVDQGEGLPTPSLAVIDTPTASVGHLNEPKEAAMTARVLQKDSQGQPLTVAVRVEPQREIVCVRAQQAGNGGYAWEPVYQLLKDRAPLPADFELSGDMLTALNTAEGDVCDEFAG